MAVLEHDPSSVFGIALHDRLCWLFLTLSHANVLEVPILFREAQLLAECLNPTCGVHPGEEHEEDRCLIGGLLESGGHVERWLLDEVIAKIVLEPSVEGHRHTIRPHCADKDEFVKLIERLVVVGWHLGDLRVRKAEPLFPIVCVRLHCIANALEFGAPLKRFDLGPDDLGQPRAQRAHVARIVRDLTRDEEVHLLVGEPAVVGGDLERDHH
mmetsp:Transcript_7285/g.13426  ORF Transcript_7285/g.13426 Transcript_7285/m.13426 type:complete len:212 (-) Transcript_7285:157-792(-)